MRKLSPLQSVVKEFGSKENLVSQLASKLEKFEGEDNDDFKARLSQVSNKKLLRLWKAQNRLESEFSNKGALVDAVVTLKNPKQANDRAYKAKLMSYKATRLLDLHDSLKKGA